MVVKCKCGALVTVEPDEPLEIIIERLNAEISKMRTELNRNKDYVKYWQERCMRFESDNASIENSIRSFVESSGIRFCNKEHEII